MHFIIIYEYQMYSHQLVVVVMVRESFRLLERRIIFLSFALLVVEFGSVLLGNERQNSSPTVRKVSSLVLFCIQLGIYGGMTVVLVTLVLLLMSDLMKT